MSVVLPVPPLPTPRVPSVNEEGFVPEQVRNPPGQEFDITPVLVTVTAPVPPERLIPVPATFEVTPVLVIVRFAPPMSAPGLPERLMPVPDDTDVVAVLYRFAPFELIVPEPRELAFVPPFAIGSTPETSEVRLIRAVCSAPETAFKKPDREPIVNPPPVIFKPFEIVDVAGPFSFMTFVADVEVAPISIEGK